MYIAPIYSAFAPNRSQNSSATSFGGITKKLKHKIYIDGQKDIKEIIDKRKEGQNTYVGELPKFLIDKLPKENRGAIIREIYKNFDEATNEIRAFRNSDYPADVTIDEIKEKRPHSASKKIDDVMHKYKLIPPFDEINLKYLGEGGKGAVYKIDGLIDYKNEDEYAMKVYHVIEGPDWHLYKSHGNYAEINSATYWTNTVGRDTQRGKFFFANISNGYMVNKFIDEDVRIPKRNVDEYAYGLKCTDESKTYDGYNRLKGYNYDWGGVRVINRSKNDSKVARYVLKTIKSVPEKDRPYLWDKFYHSKGHMDRQQMRVGLTLATKHLDNLPYYIDRCLEMNDTLVNRTLGYALKYLPHEQAVEYFTKLIKTDDEITQIILLNEIPLLAMKPQKGEICDDLQFVKDIISPRKIETYYKIAEQYAMPNTIEHLASFVHLLPLNKVKEYYESLLAMNNPAVDTRLMHKRHLLPNGIICPMPNNTYEKH